ncbi:hypothetical protein [Streptomyces sp. NPDC048392]|uniref:hypothetical protein n=1 Tax=Streptomyces sp. NPDC048392 TaxID=3365543 RepID=UPI0037121E23
MQAHAPAVPAYWKTLGAITLATDLPRHAHAGALAASGLGIGWSTQSGGSLLLDACGFFEWPIATQITLAPNGSLRLDHARIRGGLGQAAIGRDAPGKRRHRRRFGTGLARYAAVMLPVSLVAVLAGVTVLML